MPYDGGWLEDTTGLPVLDSAPSRLTALEVRVMGERLNVEAPEFGAHPSNSAAVNRAAIQAAIDQAEAAPTKTRKICFPRLYAIDSTGLTVQGNNLIFEGSGVGVDLMGSGLYTTSGDLLKLGTNATSFTGIWFRDMALTSFLGGGHIFVPQSTTADIGLGQGGIENCTLEQKNAAKSIWHQPSGGLLLDWMTRDCNQIHVQGASVPGWNLKASSGQLNEVRWEGGRVTHSGAFFFDIRTTGGAGWQIMPTWRDINFEVPTGGCIKCVGIWNPILENLQVWDLGFFGAPISTADMFWFGYDPATGSSDTRYPSLKNIWRLGVANLAGSDVDIRCQNVTGIIIENCGGLNSAMLIDLAGASTGGVGADLRNLNTSFPHVVLQNAFAGRISRFGLNDVTHQTITTDANFTLSPATPSPKRTRHTGTLTADRTITLATTGALEGMQYKIARTGGGAFNLIVGGLKNLATNQWCEVTYDGAAWYLSQFGSL